VTDREILDALHNIRELCLTGVYCTDDLSRLTLAEFDRAVPEIGKIIAAKDALLAACEGERRELTADQPSSSRSAWAKDIYRQRLARLDAAIALAYEGPSTGDRSTS
jgi:hypothetical protein